MTVRQKLLSFIAALVIFMAATFFVLSRGYLESLFRQYVNDARMNETSQWAYNLAYFYSQNDGSWVGVDAYIRGLLHFGQFGDVQEVILYNADGQLLDAVVAHPDGPQAQYIPQKADGQDEVPISINGTTVGLVEVQGSSGLMAVERRVQHSMTTASVLGTLITAIVALLAGYWFSRRLTTPLQRMTSAIRNITAGELETKLPIESKDEFGEVSMAFNEMSTQLARTETARTHLVADVAHELRIPLTIMKGQLELIQQGVKKADPEALLPIHDEVVRLTRLVQDLHQLSLAEVGKLPLQKTPTDLKQLLARIVHNFEIDIDERGLQVSLTSDLADDVKADIDPDRITQVFVNLLGNAVRYIQDGGSIELSLKRDGDFILTTVSDTGPGIDQEHLEHIFDRFYRADDDRSRETGGTGLGLAIAKEYVESHHGHIDVNSIKGQGTTFRVWLPIAE